MASLQSSASLFLTVFKRKNLLQSQPRTSGSRILIQEWILHFLRAAWFCAVLKQCRTIKAGMRGHCPYLSQSDLLPHQAIKNFMKKKDLKVTDLLQRIKLLLFSFPLVITNDNTSPLRVPGNLKWPFWGFL